MGLFDFSSAARIIAAVVVAGGIPACGAPATTVRHAESRPSAAAETRVGNEREWVFVQAPRWSGEVTSVSVPHAAEDYCFTSRANRACVSGNAWSEIAWGPSHTVLQISGRSGDDWVFDGHAEGGSASHGFTGTLRALSEDVPSQALGRPWQPPSRLNIDGTLLVWSSDGLAPLPFPGRVYDAAFSSDGRGIVLVEPGAVYFREPGGPWSLSPPTTPAPSAISRLDVSSLPGGFGALAADARRVRFQTDRGFVFEIEGVWLAEQMRRFAQHRGATLPDLVPSLLSGLLARSLVTHPSEVSVLFAEPLAHGWLAFGFIAHDLREVFLHVSPDLETRVLAAGPRSTLLSSHDGEETLALRGPCEGDAEGDTDTDHLACFRDANGARTVQLPPAFACAEVVALGSGQLLVGGEDCPSSVCGEHLLVRFDLRQGSLPLQAIPISIEGRAPPLAAPTDPEECELDVDRTSSLIPDGLSVRGRVNTAVGERFLSGPLTGTLQVFPLPDEGQLAFADSRHGLLMSRERAWTTSNGGESWDPGPRSTEGDIQRDHRLPRLRCSADACRVEDYYWMTADLAARFEFARAEPDAARSSPTDNARGGSSGGDWRLARPTLPSLTPSSALAPLHQQYPSHLQSRVRPVVGGVVETNSARPGHTHDLVWRGVTRDGAPFHVATTARPPTGQSEPLGLGGRVLAMTEEFVAFTSGSNVVDLVVVRSNGDTTAYPAPLPGMAANDFEVSWPLPLPDGGLGLYFFAHGMRWLLHFGPEGQVIAQRLIMGPRDVRDELLAWHDGALGLAVRVSDDAARLYQMAGGEREIALPQAPHLPCSMTEDTAANRFASSWGEPTRTQQELVSMSAEWVMSEERDGVACIRAMALGSRSLHGGAHFIRATAGSFRGWFISAEGTAEWPVTFPGVTAPWVPEDEYNDFAALGFSLTASRTGLELWVPRDGDLPPAGFSVFTWDSQRFTMRHPSRGLTFVNTVLRARPGMLVTSGAAYTVFGGTVQAQRVPPDGRSFADAVHGERGATLVTHLDVRDHRVDWPGDRGEPWHAQLPTSADLSWLWPRLTDDGRTLVTLAMDRAPVLQVHRLMPNGTMQSGTALGLDGMAMENFTNLEVAGSGHAVVAAVQSVPGVPIHVFGASRSNALRLLGHPIGTSLCGGPVLAVAAAPPRVVWVDCALGTERRFVRVAQLSGNRWREVVPAHALPESFPIVAAAIAPQHGVYVAYMEDGEVVLVAPRGASWEVVTRYGPTTATP